MVDDLVVVCRACERKVKMEQVKFDDVRKAYVCEVCFNATHGGVKDVRPVRADIDDAQRKVNSLKANLVKYTCQKCKYHFARQKNKEISVCPYCGSNKLEVLSKDANKIISDSDKLF